MKTNIFTVTFLITALLVPMSMVSSHCQIPCGIYDDEIRFTLMKEHVTTIEKSMRKIMELSKASPADFNQIVRWVENKEDHADKMTEIVTAYFMAQRIKPVTPGSDGYDKYVKEATLLHGMVVTLMKTRQTTDLEHCTALRTLIDAFHASYLGGHKH